MTALVEKAFALVTAPTFTPVTLEEVKDHVRVEGAEDDPYLENQVIPAAVEESQRYCRRQWCTATYDFVRGAFPGVGENGLSEIRLPLPPLQSVTHVKYYDADGTLQTFSSTKYHVDTFEAPGRIVLADGEAWPTIQRRPNPVQIRFLCGYATAAAVPANVKHAILLLAGAFFAHREPFVTGMTVTAIPDRFFSLLDPFLVREFPEAE